MVLVGMTQGVCFTQWWCGIYAIVQYRETGSVFRFGVMNGGETTMQSSYIGVEFGTVLVVYGEYGCHG